ncbi:hypothetical protein [Actinoplanes couchii]|uniref:DUF1330 domain-containing protein n=1 Tax=Actinoplanes couchii TaxID=403638 RepID=A0ABQ3XH34_9ACTN|nr:hypothetical protein [Actinoplanes couchii]MDR6320717.1 uncharacterized protein (DUF1330 family) [Actinoplanes couchii]GID57798.1 hypothetical protein Aco03nite_062020 [Actinoplanes couchii]
MAIQLCVLLWARDRQEEALADYEDAVLALLAEHDGRLLQRARTLPGAAEGSPAEIQMIEFDGQTGYDGYMADKRRLALADQRDAAVARTEIYQVTI